MKNTIKTGFIAFLAIAALGMSNCGVEASTSGGTATYAVIYNANGGSGVLTDPGSPYESGAAVTVLANTFARTGYVFTGWNTAADGNGTAYHAGAVFTINANTTLYAQWVADVQGIEMVQIQAGSFQMGSPASEPNRQPIETQHSVTLTYSFKMSKYEVTQKQYADVMGALPTSLNSDTYGRGDSYPVYYVSWYDALVFCNKLSVMEGLTPAYSIDGKTNPDEWGTVPTSSDATWNAATCNWSANGYRLPTEAEWEYACRAGTTTVFNWGTNQIASNQANFDASSNLYNGSPQGTYRAKATEVGTFAPNAWGLHDMHGNVWEWCWDWYDFYPVGAQTDPRGSVAGITRVFRGGSWSNYGPYLRSACRVSFIPFDRHLGFRLVRP